MIAILINYKQFFKKRGIKSERTREKPKSLKKSTDVHFSRSMIFLSYFTTNLTSICEKKCFVEARLIYAEPMGL